MDNLKAFCTQRSYKQAAHVLLSISDLSSYFKDYERIPQISEIIKEKNSIIETLKLQLKDEFSLYFKNMSNQSQEVLKDACILVEALGHDFKEKVVNMAVARVLDDYKELFERRDNKTLESIEKRYVWFGRQLQDFRSTHIAIFPHYWGILCFVVNEFCGITSIHASQILPTIQNNDEMVVPMIKALQSTINFENAMYKELKAEYEQYLTDSGSHRISGIPNIKGSISKCFEEFTRPYVEKEKKDLSDNIFKELAKDLDVKNKFVGGNEELNILNSSLVMFNKIKFLIERLVNKGI